MQANTSPLRRLGAALVLLVCLVIMSGASPLYAQRPAQTAAAQNPSLSAPQVAQSGNSLTVKVEGQQGGAHGAIDLYFFAGGQVPGTAAAFLGRREAATGSAGAFSFTAVARPVAGYCAPMIGIVAVSRSASLASNLETVQLPCGWKLRMQPVRGSPLLFGTVASAAITVWGAAYAPNTAVHVYLFRDGQPYSVTAITVRGRLLPHTQLPAQSGSPSSDSWNIMAIADKTLRSSIKITIDRDHPCQKECSSLIGH
jgi:hypothetical protein